MGLRISAIRWGQCRLYVIWLIIFLEGGFLLLLLLLHMCVICVLCWLSAHAL